MYKRVGDRRGTRHRARCWIGSGGRNTNHSSELRREVLDGVEHRCHLLKVGACHDRGRGNRGFDMVGRDQGNLGGHVACVHGEVTEQPLLNAVTVIRAVQSGF